MALVFPYSKYPTASAGKPVTFFVGSSSSTTRFDIHHHLLYTSSSVFNDYAGNPQPITRPIMVPTVGPFIFRRICIWLYEGKPPLAETQEDLLPLMQTWVTLSKLGLWEKQNTIMRLGMALMQPKDFVCSIETVRWVYENTSPDPPGKKLRGYVIAIFCQRGPCLTTETFSRENMKWGIFRDAVAFFRVLDKVRAGNPRGVDGYDVRADADIFHTWDPEDPSRVMATLVTDGEVDHSRVRYPLPSFLVWGDKWEDLPDKRFFINRKEGWIGGKEVFKQLKKM